MITCASCGRAAITYWDKNGVGQLICCSCGCNNFNAVVGDTDSMRFIGDDDHHYTGPNDKEAVVALLRDVVRDIRAWGSTGLFSAAEKLAMLADRFERGHLRELVQQRKEQK